MRCGKPEVGGRKKDDRVPRINKASLVPIYVKKLDGITAVVYYNTKASV
jgi:hypothetical protein